MISTNCNHFLLSNNESNFRLKGPIKWKGEEDVGWPYNEQEACFVSQRPLFKHLGPYNNGQQTHNYSKQCIKILLVISILIKAIKHSVELSQGRTHSWWKGHSKGKVKVASSLEVGFFWCLALLSHTNTVSMFFEKASITDLFSDIISRDLQNQPELKFSTVSFCHFQVNIKQIEKLLSLLILSFLI